MKQTVFSDSPRPKRAPEPGRSLFARIPGRALLIVALLSGLLIWQLPGPWIAGFALAWVVLVLASGAQKRVRRSTLWGYAIFLLFWVGLKILLDTLGLLWQRMPLIPETYGAVLLDAGVLALRLTAMAAIGVFVVGVASPRKISLAFAWLLRPFLRGNAWKAALALTLMLRFIPLVRRILRNSRTAVALRCAGMPAWRRVGLLVGVSLSLLAKQTWAQTIAVASRGLDCPEAWRETGQG